ncbi:hypothetical protein JMJ35_000291 [Cladonia borealis]|uniref:F-box domain-containing protein n=1 Tax=Cladonia borealis TaxID=184061 RepID=A0AA39UF15_9LECA|nr:hypothetical protein JMJ35_000291 [Cladonia borealis]
MYPPSSFLTLPLEIRQHVYSFLVIKKYPELYLWSCWKYSAYCLSRTCRQLYNEVPNYYYGKSVFRLSIFDYGYLRSELPTWSKRRTEYIELNLKINLKRMQHLHLEMELYDDGLSDLRQAEQLEWFCGALMRARQGSVETCWLKSLDIPAFGPGPWGGIGNSTAQGTDEEMARYKAFLRPLIGRIGKLTIRGRQVTLDDEDFRVDKGNLTRIDDSNGISGRQCG